MPQCNTEIHEVTITQPPIKLVLGSWQMPAVATQKPGVCCPQRAAVPDNYQLHLALVDVDQHAGGPVRVHQEDHGEQRHLKLWAGPHKGTAHRLHQTMPAELQVQYMVILVRLGREKTRESDYYYCAIDYYILLLLCSDAHHPCIIVIDDAGTKFLDSFPQSII